MSRIVGGKKVYEYERVTPDEWITGVIEAVQYDPNRLQNIKDKDTGEWRKETVESLRFKFRLDGYEFPHYSRWMRVSTNEKSNLYSKYLKHLCPQFDCLDKMIDLDELVGVKIKTMWEADGEFDNLTQIRGFDPDLNIIASGQVAATQVTEPLDVGEEEPPF